MFLSISIFCIIIACGTILALGLQGQGDEDDIPAPQSARRGVSPWPFPGYPFDLGNVQSRFSYLLMKQYLLHIKV